MVYYELPYPASVTTREQRVAHDLLRTHLRLSKPSLKFWQNTHRHGASVNQHGIWISLPAEAGDYFFTYLNSVNESNAPSQGSIFWGDHLGSPRLEPIVDFNGFRVSTTDYVLDHETYGGANLFEEWNSDALTDIVHFGQKIALEWRAYQLGEHAARGEKPSERIYYHG